MRVSLQLIPEQPVEELLQAAQVADELGYYGCYSADEIYHKDAWLLLASGGRTVRTDPSRTLCLPYLPARSNLCRPAGCHAR